MPHYRLAEDLDNMTNTVSMDNHRTRQIYSERTSFLKMVRILPELTGGLAIAKFKFALMTAVGSEIRFGSMGDSGW